MPVKAKPRPTEDLNGALIFPFPVPLSSCNQNIQVDVIKENQQSSLENYHYEIVTISSLSHSISLI